MSGARSILVSGAGIAGCAAAIALAERGHAIRLIERQEEWAFASSGIFLYSNALVSLEMLGVLEEILAVGFVVPEGRNRYLDHHGEPIVTTHYPPAEGGRVPAIVGIKRAELHRVLAHRMSQVGVEVELGTTIVDLVDGAESVRVVTSDDEVRVHDLVVSCEGLGSPLRQHVAPGVHASYSGFGIWRSVHARPGDLTDKIMQMGTGTRFGIMPISHDRLYTFGTVSDPGKTWHERADWPRLMREALAEYAGPARAFLDELDETSDVLYTAVDEVLLPLPWHRGRVALIGDAAHAGTPFMGQGGAMALEDALVLADCLEDADLEAALTLFEEIRYPVCVYAQDVSRRVGESGARSDGSVTEREAFAAAAQGAVDEFYAQLDRLRGQQAPGR
ncbi:monooxygenase [Janibacter sp. Soil728]|uniref:FAD-dependent oxidoreductase n=1 Tax=Janibacter sp. Soil728 TaxID=1736393 RepID=UPI0006FAD862|nr:FAD-dependent oxidoreductase [Janibacter sp. Soil728]KRE35344.1 monooxygenase [Janibacter sp. Soil728]